MSCNILACCLDAFVDRELPDAERSQIERHAAECAACGALLAREQQLRQALRQLPLPEPDAAYLDRAFARARHPELRVRNANWKVVATAALAASVATWFVAGHFTPALMPQADKPVATVSMAIHETRTIHLVFESATAIESAELRLSLPPGVELAQHRNRQEFAWKTRLRAGKNWMPLQLVVRDGSGGDLVARLSHEGMQKTFRVKVTVPMRSTNA